MEWNNKLDEMVQYINIELDKGRSMKDIEFNDFGVNERVITKRLARRGYKKVNNRFIHTTEDTTKHTTEKGRNTTSNTTSNITSNTTEPKKDISKIESHTTLNITDHTTDNSILPKNIDIDKLNLLLNNLDKLLSLVGSNTTSNITVRGTETIVTSLRINKEIYKLVKERAKERNTPITEIVNRALLDYLNRYI